MSSIITDKEQIREIIRPILREALREIVPPLVQEALYKPLLTRSEVKALTGLSDRQLQHLRDQRHVAFVQRGRVILYDTESLLRFMQEHHIRARGPVPSGPVLGSIATRTSGQDLSG